MSSEVKGIYDAYDFACDCIKNKSRFYEWIFDNPNQLKIGQLCEAPAWYEKKSRWVFTEDNYDAINEENSTWRAIPFQGKKEELEDTESTFVKKYFEIEKDEKLIATNSKYRPVILLRHYESSWYNPSNVSTHLKSWLCLPMFSYKTRHNQEYVLNDEKFLNPDRIYIPPSYNDQPGINYESAAQIQALQVVHEKYLIPLKAYCRAKEPIMNRPFKINEFGLQIILFHLFKNFNLYSYFNEKDIKDARFECNNNYYNFVEVLNEYINDAYDEAS